MTDLTTALIAILMASQSPNSSKPPPSAQELGYPDGCVAFYGGTFGVHLIKVDCPRPRIEPPFFAKVRPLSKAELTTLLLGTYVRNKPTPGKQDLSTLRQFNRDGSYIAYADNADLEGYYAVEDGKVCVKDEVHPRYCQYVAVDDEGQYYVGKSLSPYHLVPISVQPIPKQGG